MKHNFGAGPCILPQDVFKEAAEAVIDFNGLSILEVSHRHKDFVAVMDEAIELTKKALNVPEGYSVGFLQGGATLGFTVAALTMMRDRKKAGYMNTGTWASGAIKEAKKVGIDVDVFASSEDQHFTYIPKAYNIPNDLDYVHFTSNNTIYGTQIHEWPEVPVPIVCDMSSDIFSRPLPIEKFGLIYAGAQKNMGPAGVTMVVVKKDLYNKKADRHIPTMLDYKTHADGGSMYNTPPVFPILVSKYNLEWVKEMVGLNGMEIRNTEKANLLYNAIDNSPYFKGTTAVEDRSQMNVCFVFDEEHIGLEEKFNAACKEANLSGLKGHRSVGGYRASLYNALPLESVQALVNVMENFAS